MGKPRVNTRCVANAHAGPDERIVEFGAGTDGRGGLIAFRDTEAGLVVSLYRLEGVKVLAEGGDRTLKALESLLADVEGIVGGRAAYGMPLEDPEHPFHTSVKEARAALAAAGGQKQPA